LDLFYHDSLHTFEHMLWEYQTAWRFLRDGGILLSDDIFWNRAFRIFAREVKSQSLIKCGTGLIRKNVALRPQGPLAGRLHAKSLSNEHFHEV
jgi:hypothetical protein